MTVILTIALICVTVAALVDHRIHHHLDLHRRLRARINDYTRGG